MHIPTDTNRNTPSLRLAQGQLWRMKGTYIKIVEVGTTLIHYKIVRGLKQMRRTQTVIIETMLNYLQIHHAQLVTCRSRN